MGIMEGEEAREEVEKEKKYIGEQRIIIRGEEDNHKEGRKKKGMKNRRIKRSRLKNRRRRTREVYS
jgi:hypothetical protein